MVPNRKPATSFADRPTATSSDIARRMRDAGIYAIMDGISALSVGLFIAGGLPLALRVPVTIGLIVAFVDYLSKVFVPIRDFSGRFATIQRAIAALERVFGL